MLRHVAPLVASLLLAAPALAQTYNEALGTSAGASITTGDYNVHLGDRAGQYLTTASQTVFVGFAAGRFQTNDSENICIGYGAGAGGDYLTVDPDSSLGETTPTPDGVDNVFIGQYAGLVNKGSDGTFVGTKAGWQNTSGYDNTFIGEESGYSNTTGTNNTFVGEDAGYSNTTGTENTAVGDAALRSTTTGNYNTAVGYEAGYDNGNSFSGTYSYVGNSNTSLGAYAGTDIGFGNFNTMIGRSAGENTEYGSANTFVGYFAGYDNNRTNVASNSGERNTYVGAGAGMPIREGIDNTIIGASMDTGAELKSADCAESGGWGNYSDCVDFSSGGTYTTKATVVGSSVYLNADEGVTIGYDSYTKGARAITIGAGAKSTHADAIVIGYGALSHGADTAVIGNDDTLSWDPHADAVTALGTTSYRFTDVVAQTHTAIGDEAGAATMTLSADLATDSDDSWQLAAADGGDFTLSSGASGSYAAILTVANTGDATLAGDLTLDSDERLKQSIAPLEGALDLVCAVEGVSYAWRPELGRDGDVHFGVIAQQVREVLPELVSEAADGILSVNYLGLVPLLVEAVKELRDQRESDRALLDDALEGRALLAEQVRLQREENALLRRQVELQQALLEKLGGSVGAGAR